jgi:hypothetical protein
MVNKVVLIGNLGRDPELFHAEAGQAVARLSLATNEEWMKDGERQRRTEWHRIVVWGPAGGECRGGASQGNVGVRISLMVNAAPSKGRAVAQDGLGQCAWAAARTKGTYLQAQYHRLKSRRRAKKAAVAVAVPRPGTQSLRAP